MRPWDPPAYLGWYRERCGLGPWAEPVNALTDLAFLAAAWWLMRRIAEHPRATPAWDLWLLSGLVTAIGSVSALRHLFATRWAEIADVCRLPCS